MLILCLECATAQQYSDYVTDYKVGNSGFDSEQGRMCFCSLTDLDRLWVLSIEDEDISPRLKRPERDDNRSTPYSAKD
jgi:hypothetical protein